MVELALLLPMSPSMGIVFGIYWKQDARPSALHVLRQCICTSAPCIRTGAPRITLARGAGSFADPDAVHYIQIPRDAIDDFRAFARTATAQACQQWQLGGGIADAAHCAEESREVHASLQPARGWAATLRHLPCHLRLGRNASSGAGALRQLFCALFTTRRAERGIYT